MTWSVFGLELIVSFALTLFGYLFVPVILAFLGKKYGAKKIKRINTINCIVVWVLFRILQITLTGESSSGVAVFLWGTVGYWILKRNCLEETEIEAVPSSETASKTSDIYMSLSNENEVQGKYGRNDGPLSDLVLKHDEEIPGVVPMQPKEYNKTVSIPESPVAEKKSKKYCSRCGNPIDPDTKKCRGCGKQYFKGIPWKKFLGIITILSFALNVHFYFKTMELTDINALLETENGTLKEEIDGLKFDIYELKTRKGELERKLDTYAEEIAFYDEYIVFVADDGSRLYHNYDCAFFQNCTSFWVYGFEEAERKGYKPCSLCQKSSVEQPLSYMEELDYRYISFAIGKDYEISATELKNLLPREINRLASQNIVFTCSAWKNQYHSVSCERLTGMCSVGIKSVVERDGYRPCSACQD